MKPDFKLHNSFAFWLQRLNSLLQEQFNQQLKAYDVSWSQWMLLNILEGSEANMLTPAILADAMGIDRSGVTSLLDRLESKAMVQREHDKLDRRSGNVGLTEKALSAMANINSLAYQHQEAFLSELHLSERRGLKKELQKILKTSGADTATSWQRLD